MRGIPRCFALAICSILALCSYPAWGATPEQNYYEGMKYLEETQQWYEAIHSFQDAVEADPNYWQAYEGLARAYDKVGNREKALEAARTSVDLHPDNPELQKLMNRLSLRPPELNAPRPPVTSAKETYQVALMGGISFNNKDANLGFSGGVRGLCLIEPRIGIGATLDYQSILTSSQTVIDDGSRGTGRITQDINTTSYAVDLLASIQYRSIGETAATPYLLGGLGFSRPGSLGTYALNSKNPAIPSVSQDLSGGGDIFAMAQVGAGLEFTPDNSMNLFLECKLNAILSGNIYVFFPINGGILFEL